MLWELVCWSFSISNKEAMAAIRLSAGGSAVSAASSGTSIRVAGNLCSNWAPKSLFDSEAKTATAAPQR